MRTIEKGDSARAAGLLDRILAVEPTNREALWAAPPSRWSNSSGPPRPTRRPPPWSRPGPWCRRLRRSYEKSNKRELELFGHVLYEELRRDSRQGRYDRAVATLKEVHDAGFEPFNRIENDKELAGLRALPNYRAVMEEIDAAELARARDHLKSRFSRPMDFAFGFNVKDVDGKPISLEQFKGKVVLIDIWGTWCEPCRKAIPGLAQLYFKYRRHGFEVIGLTIEQSIPDPEEVRRHVKKFVQESGIPYRIAMGDDPTLKQLPNYPQISFPTTLLIDRAGKVRVFFGQNSEEVLPTLDDASAILLAEPAPAAPKPADSKAAPKPPADSKAAPKPPADSKAAPSARRLQGGTEAARRLQGGAEAARMRVCSERGEREASAPCRIERTGADAPARPEDRVHPAPRSGWIDGAFRLQMSLPMGPIA